MRRQGNVGKAPCNNRGKARSDTATNQGLTPTPRNSEEARKYSTQSQKEHHSNDTLILNV